MVEEAREELFSVVSSSDSSSSIVASSSSGDVIVPFVAGASALSLGEECSGRGVGGLLLELKREKEGRFVSTLSVTGEVAFPKCLPVTGLFGALELFVVAGKGSGDRVREIGGMRKYSLPSKARCFAGTRTHNFWKFFASFAYDSCNNLRHGTPNRDASVRSCSLSYVEDEKLGKRKNELEIKRIRK